MDLVALALQCFWPRVYLSEIKIVAVTLFNLYFSDIPRPFFLYLTCQINLFLGILHLVTLQRVAIYAKNLSINS